MTSWSWLSVRAVAGVAAAAILLLAVPRSGVPGPRPPVPAELTAAERGRVSKVLDTPTVATRYDVQPFPARRDVLEYLLDHPEFATHVTRTLRLARYRVWRAADGLWIDDGWGARGRFETLHAGKGVRVLYARGEYEQRLMPNIPGEAVIVIQYAERPAAGRTELATVISGFVKIDSGWYAAASWISGSIAASKAEEEARRLGKVLARTTRAIEEDPARVVDLLRQRADVPRRELEEFRQLLNLPRTSVP